MEGGWIAVLVALVVVQICFGGSFFLNRCFPSEDPALATVRTTIAERRQQRNHPLSPRDIETATQSPVNIEGQSPISSKTEQLLCKFKFQTVTANQSNYAAASIRAPDDMGTKTEDAGDDDGSVILTPSQHDSKLNFSSMLSTWRKPPKDDSCCICLEAYNPGDTICTAMTASCDHVFHQECIFEWLESGHVECPLCRVDLMNV